MSEETTGAPVREAAPAVREETPAISNLEDMELGATKDSAECEIYNTRLPDCPSTGIFIEVWSPDSDHYKKAAHKIRAAAAQSPTRRTLGAQLSQKEDESLNRALMVASVKGWRGNIRSKGEPLECTPQNVHGLFEKYPIIQQQVLLFHANRGNF